jgi:hypothetical protein
MSDETVPISSLLTHQNTLPHTNGNTVQTVAGRYIHKCIHYLFRSFLADAANSFAWGTYLKTTGSHAAPVSYFRHVNNSNVFLELNIFFFDTFRHHYIICGYN